LMADMVLNICVMGAGEMLSYLLDANSSPFIAIM
jgi:hypothetical protein